MNFNNAFNQVLNNGKNHIMIAIKLRAIIIFIIFTIPIMAMAQDTELNAHPAMWLVEKGNSKTYMLGSIHLLSPEVNWYGGLIEDVMDDTDEVVFEVNMTPGKEREAGMISRSHDMLPEGDSLGNYLSEEEYALAGTQATALGIPPAALDRLQPWLVSISLSISAIQKEGWDQNSGVDKHIKTLADARGIKISELETLDAQLATLWDHPLDIQSQMLKDTLKELGDITNITMNMVAAWSGGDESEMEEVFLIPMMEQKDLFQSLVLDRNNNWVPVIEELISKEQNTLIVAGAAHFVGEKGVVSLLREKGYDVIKVQ